MMKLFSAFVFTMLFLSADIFGQSLTELIFPRYVQGTGDFVPANDRKTPFACRLKVDGLTPNATYRYTTGFVDDPGTLTSEGNTIHINPSTGAFVRSVGANLSAGYGQFTTDATGTYTGWFMAEVNHSFIFYPYPGSFVYFRLTLNNGSGGTSPAHYLSAADQVTTINFGATPDDGTAVRSTPAASGVAKNFVMLWDDATDRPVCGSVIENDGVANTVANGYADFYDNAVNGVDKTWGVIIPNSLTSGIKKIVQYSLSDASELGSKTSTDGSWAKEGGGTVSTVNATGGLSSVIVLDGAVITLGAPVQLPQTITFNVLPAKTYGDADAAPGATSSSALPVSYTSSNTAVATIVNGSIHITGAGATDIRAEQAGNTDYSAATPVVQTLTVNKAALTIKADDKNKVQGDPLPVFTVSYTGFVNGEDATVLISQPTIGTTANPASPAGQYPITASGADAANYTIAYVAGTLTITPNKQSQTITFGPVPAKTYGNADFSPGATITSGLTIVYSSNDPAVATIVNGKLHITGTGTTTITAGHPGDDNYEPAADVTQVLTVDKAPLTITADNKTKLVGQVNPALTITYAGFVNNENNTQLTTQPVISTTAITSSPTGNYPITVSGAAAVNYTISYVNGTLTVSPLPAQTITFNGLPAKQYGNAPFAAGASASSGLPITYTSSNVQVAVIESGVIRITGAGTTTITAAQPGDATHAPATNVDRPLTVQKANLLIQAKDTSKTEGQVNPPLLFTISGFVNGDDVTKLGSQPVATTVAVTGSVPGKYPITVSNVASNNYNIGVVNGTLTILPPQGASQDNMNAFMSSPGQLQVNIYSVEAGKATIQLFDQQGTRLQQINVALAKGYNTYRLPVGNVIAGIYHVRVAGPGFILKNKVVIK